MSHTPHKNTHIDQFKESVPLSTLKGRLQALRSDMFHTRYIMKNCEKALQTFYFINYKGRIRKCKLKAVYLVPLLCLRKLSSYITKLNAPLLQKPFFTKRIDEITSSRIMRYILTPVRACIFALLDPMNACIRAYIYGRFLAGRVDMPYFELVLTTKCSLRCESCNNLMQYFTNKTAYTCTIEGITATLEKLFSHIDSVYWVRIIGGEPLLFKDIDKVVSLLDSTHKVKSFDIVTNGTIVPKESLLQALAKSDKSFVSISDYTISPNLTTPLKIDELSSALTRYHIPHYCLWQEQGAQWRSPGKIYKRNRSVQGIIHNFRSCLMPCVSIMSHEDILRGATQTDDTKLTHTSLSNHITPPTDSSATLAESSVKQTQSKTTHLAKSSQKSVGEIFICPIASSLSRLRGLDEFAGDFISLDETCDKYAITHFYMQDFFKACDFCHDMDKTPKNIPVAIQTKETLTTYRA